MVRTQQGFTLIELMVVVAVIGILAGLAITYFGRTQKNTKARAEVAAMFASMKIKQEQAMLELGAYQDCGVGDNTEGNFFPASLAGNGNKTTASPPPAWLAMGLAPTAAGLLCQYACVHGAANIDTVGPLAKAQFGFGTAAAPVPAADPWYYLLARCDMDSNAGNFSFYFQNSSDSGLFHTNQGD